MDVVDVIIFWLLFIIGSEKYLVLDLCMKIEECLFLDCVVFWNDFIFKLMEDEELVRKIV